MSSLANLKGQRTRLSKRITQTMESANKLLSVSVPDDGLDDISEQVDSHVDLCKDLSSRYEVLSCKIVDAMNDKSDDDLEAEGETSAETVLDLAETISKLSSRQRKIAVKLQQSVAPAITADSVLTDQFQQLLGMHETKSIGQPSSHCSVNLPKLDFDQFFGDVLKWSEFWDSFSASVDLNSNLQPVQKLAYLRAKLRGEAKSVIAGLETTNDNYDVAVGLLRERFGNEQAAISAHYSRLMDIPPSPNHTDRLRGLTDSLEQQLRCLSSLGEDVNHRHFISLIMHKLPEAVIVKLEEMKEPQEEWTVELLRNKLASHLAAREAAGRHSNARFSQAFSEKKPSASGFSATHKGHHHNAYNRTNGVRENRTQVSTTDALYNNDRYAHKKPDQREKLQQCVFCQGKHWNDECRKYKTASARRRQLQGRCFNCFSKKHRIRECISNRSCYHCKKLRDHHSSLCPQKFQDEKETTHVAAEEDEERASDGSLLASGERALLQTAAVSAFTYGSNEQVRLRLLFDSGSHRSYISAEAAKKLNLQAKGTETISVNTFACRKAKSVETKVVEVQLKLQGGASVTIVANVVPTISAQITRQPLDLSKYSSVLKGLRLADPLPAKLQHDSIDILIGSDYYADLLTFEKITLGDNLHLLGSKFGWILVGRSSKWTSTAKSCLMLILNFSNQSVSELNQFQFVDKSCPVEINTEDFWNLETIGIKEPNSDVADDQATATFDRTVQYKDNRYFVQWPWREEYPNLPSNFQLSLGRLKSSLRRLSANPSMLQQYSQIIDDQIRKGIIEKVDWKDDGTRMVHYIPHQALVKPQNDTTKVRIVYDASAKVRKEALSLNECLLRGPVMLENLCGLLMRFRMHKYAVIADIEKAFLQIGLQQKDRDVVRFLWLRDTSNSSADSNLQVYRFTRVPFGVISSPFLLAATIHHHLNKANTQVAKQIAQHVYVDNMITGASTTQDLKSIYDEAKELFSTASMNLREWTSNSILFTDSLVTEDKCQKKHPKVLGLVWSITEDSLSISKVDHNLKVEGVTKRDVFKKIAQYFDPLGFVSPVIIKAKIFLQELWSEKLKWDDRLSSQQQEIWKKQLKDLAEINHLSVPRYIGIENTPDVIFRLVAFCDASAKAYASVIYLHWIDQYGEVGTALMFAKSRLAPVKRQTIPRLELLAALIGVRSLKFVEEHLNLHITEKSLWSDSQCILHWIRSNKPQTIFVKNRLNEIKSHTDVNFNFVKSEDNPADLPSRGVSAEDLTSSQMWWSGPSWFKQKPSMWPQTSLSSWKDSDDSTKGSSVLFEASMKATEEEVTTSSPYGINMIKYSSLLRLLRVTAWCSRFVARLKHDATKTTDWISSAEINGSKLLWKKFVQKQEFGDALKAIASGKKNEVVTKFDLHLDDDGLLHCGGRLQNLDLPDKTKFPVLLPKKHYFTSLVVEDIHRRLMHAGTSQTLAELRREYWIPQGRRQVQNILSKCTICRRWEGGSYRMPPMPPIPHCRVGKTTPFSYTGVDYFGPLYVKSNSQRSKVWVCLYTCMTVRAIHLELVSDLSAQEFLLSLRRFISRRGTPRTIFSDNGSNFQAASKVVHSIWNTVVSDLDLQTYVASSDVQWHFIPQFSPWMGGFYERLIGLVKRHLRKAIGRICLTFIQLQTVLTEVEATVNSRPLTYVGEDITTGYPISPAHFLSLNPKIGLPGQLLQFNPDDTNDPDYCVRLSGTSFLLDSWKKGHQHLNDFWKAWHQDYLLSLRERSQKHLSQPFRLSPFSPASGDLVLVKEDFLPRGSWKIARILTLIPSSDGQCRTASLILPSHKQLIRPLTLLYPLECSMEPEPVTIPSPGGIIPSGRLTVQDSSASSSLPLSVAAPSGSGYDGGLQVGRAVHKATPVEHPQASSATAQPSDDLIPSSDINGSISSDKFSLHYICDIDAYNACSVITSDKEFTPALRLSSDSAVITENPVSVDVLQPAQASDYQLKYTTASTRLRLRRKAANDAHEEIQRLAKDGKI